MSSWLPNSMTDVSGRIGDVSSSVTSSLRSSLARESRPPVLEFDESAPSKTIYLIRHAESEENVKMHGLQEVGTSIMQRRLPTSEDMGKGMSFIYSGATGDTDSDLSPQGKEQIRELNRMMDVDSQKNMYSVINDVEMIGHSPLIRARETCYGAFGLDRNELPENVFELPCLEEVTPWETVVQGRKNTVQKRLEELHDWIDKQTDASTIALVGHSEYFMIMLGISRAEKFWNCDVWKVQYQSGGRWKGLELKHRITSSKPMGMM